MSVEAFPLYWPEGQPRSKSTVRSSFKTGFGAARQFLFDELKRLGAKEIVLSTNIPLRNDGLPRANVTPKDLGVAVYFKRKGRQVVFACDKFTKSHDNIYAIGKTIEAIRGIERWGTSEMMDRAFTGFAALPASTDGPSWWKTLGISAFATEEEIQAAYREKAKKVHSDHVGGNEGLMRELNVARDQALSAARGRG